MRKITVKDCILIDCISFTAVSVILSLLAYNEKWVMDISYANYLQIFLCTSLIAFIGYFVDRIPVESQGASQGLMLMNVAVVIFGVGGGIFHWFPWEPIYILEVAIILSAVHIITMMIMFWQDKEVAKIINDKIKESENESHN